VASLEAARTRWRPSDLVIFAGLLACGVIAIESTRTVREVQGTVGRDLQTVWYLAIAITLPPACALLAPLPLTAYRLWRVRRAFVYRRVFSNATISLAYGSASLIFHSVPASAAGARPGIASHALTWAGVVAGCGAIAWVINNGLLLGAIKIADPQARIRDMFGNREVITSDLIELSLAVSLSLVVSINAVLMTLALPSVVLYRRYLMNAQLVAQARIDAKTGLLNAGTWQREAEVELLRALRGHTPLALAMVDIDHFRDVNDMAGQLVRDQLIRDIAGMLKDQLPSHDLIGRYGSEEFAILLPQTGRVEAQRITERLRDHIAAEPIAIESGSQEGFVFRLTVSIGVAVLNESRRALSELIGAADSALGEAKSTGWSKVYVLPDSPDELRAS
jgi:diguanylate cyclase (GGDEF)-like protein